MIIHRNLSKTKNNILQTFYRKNYSNSLERERTIWNNINISIINTVNIDITFVMNAILITETIFQIIIYYRAAGIDSI